MGEPKRTKTGPVLCAAKRATAIDMVGAAEGKMGKWAHRFFLWSLCRSFNDRHNVAVWKPWRSWSSTTGKSLWPTSSQHVAMANLFLSCWKTGLGNSCVLPGWFWHGIFETHAFTAQRFSNSTTDSFCASRPSFDEQGFYEVLWRRERPSNSWLAMQATVLWQRGPSSGLVSCRWIALQILENFIPQSFWPPEGFNKYHNNLGKVYNHRTRRLEDTWWKRWNQGSADPQVRPENSMMVQVWLHQGVGTWNVGHGTQMVFGRNSGKDPCVWFWRAAVVGKSLTWSVFKWRPRVNRAATWFEIRRYSQNWWICDHTFGEKRDMKLKVLVRLQMDSLSGWSLCKRCQNGQETQTTVFFCKVKKVFQWGSCTSCLGLLICMRSRRLGSWKRIHICVKKSAR